MTDYLDPVSPIKAGLACRCPRCGEGRVFSGFLDIRSRCSVCGLDLTKVDTGDGPAVFIIMIVGFIVVGLALWTEITFEPPYWVHLVLWLPAILILSFGLLRPFKATLLALQYKHKAAEGTLDGGE